MTIATRLKLNALLLTSLVVFICLAITVALLKQDEAREKGYIADYLMKGAFELNTVSDYYLRNPGKRPKAQWKQTHGDLAMTLKEIAPVKSGERLLVNRMNENLGDLRILFTELVATYEEAAPGTGDEGKGAVEASARADQISDLILLRSRELSMNASRLVAESKADRESLAQRINAFAITGVIILILSVLGFSAVLFGTIAGPLRKLRAGVEIVGSGDLDHRIGISTRDELGELAVAFDNMTERIRESRTELSRTAVELQEAQRIAHIGSWELDSATGAVTWSEELHRIFGRDPESPAPDYESLDQVLTPESLARMNAAMEITLRTGSPYEIELELVRPDGTHRWINARAEAVYEPADRIVGARGTAQDITERKQAEAALVESEELYRSLVENIDFGVNLIDRDFKIRMSNATVGKWFTKPACEFVGRNCFKEFEKRREICKHCPAVEAMATGLPRQVDTEGVRDDGSHFLVRVHAFPLYYPDGEPKGFVEVIEDITERRSMEEDIAWNLAVTQALSSLYIPLVTASDTIGRIAEIILEKSRELTGSVHGYVAEIDPETGDMIAHTNSKMMQTECTIAKEESRKIRFPRRDDGLYNGIWGHALNVREPFFTNEPEKHYASTGIPEGHIVIERFLSVPVMLGGELVGQIALANSSSAYTDRDLSAVNRIAEYYALAIQRTRTEEEQARLQEQLRQSQKMEAVGLLAGGVAHDFNNLLMAIVSYGGVLQLKMAEDDPLKPYVDKMLTVVDRAAGLTQSLLAFSRKQVMNLQPYNLNEIVRKVEKLLARIIGEDIRIQTNFMEDPLIVNVDSGQIEQVLMNLATNGRDAMPQGGTLSIVTESSEMDGEYIKAHGYGEPGRYAQFSVSDSGTGMDAATVKRIFEPFFTTKELGRGTGLGLAVVYGIVKQHGGFINVYSEPGIGTTFHIRLPLMKGGECVGEEPAPRTQPTGGTETILLAEDEKELRKLMKAVLTEFGYTVIEAEDGEDAVRKFTEYGERIQLLLLDVIMPKKSGKDACGEIRKMDRDVLTLFISGYPPDVIQGKGLLEEGCDLVMKPVSPQNLLKKIREVLER